MANFPIQEAQLISLFMQSTVYGVHVVTFLMCMWALLRPLNSGRPVNWPWLSVAVILFAIGTADVSFNLYHNLIAFIYYTGLGGAQAQFEDLSSWVNVMRTVWILLQATVSDAALVYRCWIIYDRRWYVALLPALLWLASTVCAGAEAYYTATLEDMSTIPDTNMLEPLIAAYCTLTLATNLLCTGLIAYRIWRVDRQSSRFFSQTSRGSVRVSLRDVNRIMIESALLYTSAIAVTFIVEVAGSNAEYNVSDVGLELAGIAFDLIIIRIGRGIAAGQVRTPTPSETVAASPITLRAIRSRGVDPRLGGSGQGSVTDIGKDGSQCDLEGGSCGKDSLPDFMGGLHALEGGDDDKILAC